MKFSEKIRVNRNQTRVFDFTQDYAHRLVWDKFLIRAELVNGARQAGLGEKAYCVARNGIGMEIEYVSFQRPKVTAVRMTKGPYLFKSFLGSWTFHPIAPDETEVIFLYAFTLRFPFNLASFLVKYLLQREVKARLTDLKAYLEKASNLTP
jgi:hypothetical protein